MFAGLLSSSEFVKVYKLWENNVTFENFSNLLGIHSAIRNEPLSIQKIYEIIEFKQKEKEFYEQLLVDSP